MRGRKRRNDIDSSEMENVVTLYKNKISLKQIAFDYDVTAYVVRDVLVNMGVEIGPRGRPWARNKVLDVKASYQSGTYAAEVKDDNTYSEEKQNEIDMEAFAQEVKLLDLGDFRRPLGE